MPNIIDELRPVLSPKSIAIVGASSDFSKFTGRTVKYLLKHGYSGKFYPVNPKREEIAGHPCYPTVSDLPEPVDTAFIQIPAKIVPRILKECIEKGVRSAIIHSAGMGEEGEAGRSRQEKLRGLARDAGMRVVGPNCAGMANFVERTILSPVVCYELDRLIPGRIGLVSQSGGLTGAYVARAEARGIGFSHVISTGNEMDLEACDYIEYLLNDDHTDVVAVFLEALRNGKKFLRISESALEAKKPIIVLKIGRTSIGARAAASHTGALTGSDAVYNAVFKQKGVVRVETMEDLFEVASLFCKTKPPGGNRVGVVTTTGGGATILVEAGAQHGLDFPLPSDDAVNAASEFLPSFAAKSNPMDVTMSGAGGGYKKGLEVMLEDPAFDMVVGVVGTSSQFAPELGVKPLVAVSPTAHKPLVAFCNPNAEAALRLFEHNRIPSFRTPEACARALGHLVAYGRYLDNRIEQIKGRSESTDIDVDGAKRHQQAEDVIKTSGKLLNEFQSKKVLSAYGIPVPKEELVNDIETALEAAHSIGYPIVLKVLSPDIPHKSDAGVIKLGIETENALKSAYNDAMTKARVCKPGIRIDGVLVQQMLEKGMEVIVGMILDEQFGPTLLFGTGGVWVEVFQDVSHRVVPISGRDAAEMIRETRGSILFDGYRGMREMDMDAVVSALQKVARLSEDFNGMIQEMDINPLMVYEKGEGVVAVDALIRMS